MRIFRATATLMIVVFLLLSPGYIKERLASDPFRAFFDIPEAKWHGKIELWHIVSFRTYQGSVTKLLRERATAWNKSHPGIHIEVVGMTEKKFQERIARGEFPDAYSFASGVCYLEQLQALSMDAPKLTGSIPCATNNGDLYAVPYLYSGYFLLGNAELLATSGMELAASIDPAMLQAALDQEKKTPQLCMPPVLAARANLTGTLAVQEGFCLGRTLFAIGDARFLGDLVRSEKNTVLFETVPYPGYTDQIQYLGAAAGTDSRRLDALSEFFTFLLTQEEQARVTTVGAFPVRMDAVNIVFSEPLLTAYYQSCGSMTAPDPFLYQRHRQALEADALRALSDESGGKKAFWERMDVVMFTKN